MMDDGRVRVGEDWSILPRMVLLRLVLLRLVDCHGSVPVIAITFHRVVHSFRYSDVPLGPSRSRRCVS